MDRRLRHYLGWPRWRLAWMSAATLLLGGTLFGVVQNQAYDGAAWARSFDAPWGRRRPSLHIIGDGPAWPAPLTFLQDPAFLSTHELLRQDGKYGALPWDGGFVYAMGDGITTNDGRDFAVSRVGVSGQDGAPGVQYRITRHRWGAPLRWVESWRCEARQGPTPPRERWREYDVVAGLANFAACLGVFGLPLVGPALFVSLRRRRRGRCPACGYDLRSDLTRGCTECGWRRDDQPDSIAETTV